MTRTEEKQQLRRTMRALEASLSTRYKEESSRAIAGHLLAMPEYQEAGTVFCFVGTDREINTYPILEDVLAAGKRLCVPLCIGKGIMELRQVTDLRQLVPGSSSGIRGRGRFCRFALPDLQPSGPAPGPGRRLL